MKKCMVEAGGRGRLLTALSFAAAVLICLGVSSTGAAGQTAASSTPQNPLEVVDFMADLPSYNGQKVYVQGQPYCLSSQECLLYDQSVDNKFIDFDSTLTSQDDRKQFLHCALPIHGAGCMVVIGGVASSDPDAVTNIFASSVQWITAP